MKKIIAAILVFIAMIVISPLLISCGDSSNEIDDWDINYVYLQRKNYLELPNFTYNHTPAGIAGNPFAESFFIKTVKAVEQDVKIRLSLTNNNVPDEYIELSTKEVLIKAGEMSSEEILISIPDLNFMLNTMEKVIYNFQITIEMIETKASDVRISDLRKNMNVSITKSKFKAFQTGSPSNGVRVKNRNEWVVTAGQEVEGDPSVVKDNSFLTYVSHPNGALEIMFDFQETYIINGLAITHRQGEVPSQIELFTSKDGIEWKSIGGYEHVADPRENITFLAESETRYLKYKVMKASGRVSIAEFYVFTRKV